MEGPEGQSLLPARTWLARGMIKQSNTNYIAGQKRIRTDQILRSHTNRDRGPWLG